MKIVKASEAGEAAVERLLTKAAFDEVELNPKIREANKKTFGRDMTAAELVRQIVGDVRREGDAASSATRILSIRSITSRKTSS